MCSSARLLGISPLGCLQVYNQSAEDGAISTLRAATDPTLTGQGFKYFGPFYKGPLLIHTGNESKQPCTGHDVTGSVILMCVRVQAVNH